MEESKTAASYWYQDFLQAKLAEIKPVLTKKIDKKLAQKIEDGKKFDKREVLQVIEAIFKHCQDQLWTSEDIENAWQKSRAKKNDRASEKAREQGNVWLQKGQLNKALNFYNEAVLFAQPNGVNLCLAFANRAFLWLKFNEFHRALVDLEMVIKERNYPKESLFKIYQRLGLTYQKLGKTSESINAYSESIKCLSNAKLAEEKKLLIANDTKITIGKVKKDIVYSSSKTFPAADRNISLEVKEEHREIQGFTNKIAIQYTPHQGRFSVATEVIEPGEVISRDKAVTSIILFNENLEFCYHCLLHVASPIPCQKCAAVVFCSQQCQLAAHQRHQYDCPLSTIDLYLAYGPRGIGATSVQFLAMRGLTKKPAQFFADHCDHFDEQCSEKMPNCDPEYEGLDIMFNSVTHLDSYGDIMVKIMGALFQYKWLHLMGYFDQVQANGLESYFKDERRQSQVFYTNLILHCALTVLSNNHSISACIPTKFERKKYGLAMFPKVASLINHSCNPNTGTVVQKDVQITIATKRIYPGEEICQVYQCHFADTPWAERQSILNNLYHFQCLCKACQGKFPLYQDLEGGLDSPEYEQLSKDFQDAFEANKLAKACDIVVKKLIIASEMLKEPHKIFVTDRAALIECFWHCYGNKVY